MRLVCYISEPLASHWCFLQVQKSVVILWRSTGLSPSPFGLRLLVDNLLEPHTLRYLRVLDPPLPPCGAISAFNPNVSVL